MTSPTLRLAAQHFASLPPPRNYPAPAAPASQPLRQQCFSSPPASFESPSSRAATQKASPRNSPLSSLWRAVALPSPEPSSFRSSPTWAASSWRAAFSHSSLTPSSLPAHRRATAPETASSFLRSRAWVSAPLRPLPAHTPAPTSLCWLLQSAERPSLSFAARASSSLNWPRARRLAPAPPLPPALTAATPRLVARPLALTARHVFSSWRARSTSPRLPSSSSYSSSYSSVSYSSSLRPSSTSPALRQAFLSAPFSTSFSPTAMSRRRFAPSGQAESTSPPSDSRSASSSAASSAASQGSHAPRADRSRRGRGEPRASSSHSASPHNGSAPLRSSPSPSTSAAPGAQASFATAAVQPLRSSPSATSLSGRQASTGAAPTPVLLPSASAPLLAATPQPAPAAPQGSDRNAALEKLFGGMGNAQFNKYILDEENVLHFYGIRQAVLRPVVHEDCRRGGPAAATAPPATSRRNKEANAQNQMFRVSLSWTISGKRKVETEGVGRSKKDAKKDAVKTLLAQLGPVTLHEYEQVTRCLFSSLRGKIQGKQSSYPAGCEHRFVWTFMSGGEEVKIDSVGRGHSATEAEIGAMQDMYLKVLKYRDCQTEEREKINRQVSQARQQQAAESRKAASQSPQLAKQDAGEINQQHHNLTTRNQIKPTEMISMSAEGYRCNLQWRWTGRDGRSRTLSCVGIGLSKPLARASAALQMMGLAGFVQPVNAHDRQAARALVNLVTERPDGKTYVSKACTLLEATTSGVWRLFLPTVWRAALAENERSLVDALLNTMKKVTAASTPSSAAENEVASSAPSPLPSEDGRAMPPDLWEQLLDECTVLTNCTFGQAVLHELGDLHLDQSYFPSPLAKHYFQNYRLMLALEWQAQLAAGIEDRKAYGDLFEGKHMTLNCKSAVMPIFSLGTALKTEDREFLANVQFREDDCVLLRPYDEQRGSEDTWRKCFVGVVTSVKNDGANFNVNVRLASGEGAKHPDILTCRKFKLYHLTPAVTHDRMVEALRSLTMHRMPITQSTSSYAFTPEIRYLLLHTGEGPAKEVASRGPVPVLSDVDPALFDPLHRLNELADAQAAAAGGAAAFGVPREDAAGFGAAAAQNSKKQRVQQSSAVGYPHASPLLSQVALQARNQLEADKSSFSTMPREVNYDDIILPTDLPLTGPQKAACLSALTNRLTLVQGPPGTGKTHVACAIIDAWQRNDPTKKILAVADSNVAADNLMEGLSARGIRSVRVGNGSESDLQEEAIADLGRYRDYLRLKQNGMFGEAKTVRMALFREAVRRQPVIIATCVGSGHEMFDDLVFSRVIIDEGAQAIEPSNLIPLAHGCRNFVLIGDHKQLPPTILSPEAAARGLDVSLLERFVSSGIAPIHLLDEQRRMHPSIAYFPNLQFYEGKIQSRDVDDRNRPVVAGFRWPSQHSRVCLVDISAAGLSGAEASQGTSKYSLAEIDPIVAILQSVANEGSVLPSQIGVLTPYDAQKARLRKAINETFEPPACYHIEVDSVDGFQGKEKDLIIFSAVRSNPRGEIGFLRDPRRMNVMLTRAKRGVIVIGDQLTLWNDLENWRPWIQWVGSMRSIIPITRLNDHLETPGYVLPSLQKSPSGNVLHRSASHASRLGFAGGTSGAVGARAGGGAATQVFVPQGFQCDFDTRRSSQMPPETQGTVTKKAAEEEEEREKQREVPEDWEELL
ncbi:AAA family protein [Besnoitia besnoiti]|uniref:AAA family protein n=1 Tax=Besnoitia besnoiti TaxID=94643 RepID=A0A2A9M575_BESBE|nr:AAA family protein [Besnoitia besnoiti]PFH32354.1 AAA family protein [Besnoitia besnoiti]